MPEPGAVEAPVPEITRDIYGMPAFVTLEVADIDATVSWYVDGLGFINLFTLPGPTGTPVLVHLRRWRYQDILVRPATGPVVVPTGLRVAVSARYEDLDEMAARARAHGGGQVEGPTDTPWNSRDLTTVDPDGYQLVFTAPRPQDQWDQAFAQRIVDLDAEQNPPR